MHLSIVASLGMFVVDRFKTAPLPYPRRKETE